MAAGWACKECGFVNDRQVHECERCGARRVRGVIPKGPLMIGIGGVVILAIIALAIYSLLTLPKKKYYAALVEAYQDRVITPDEEEQLDRLAKLYRLTDDQIALWRQGVIGRDSPPRDGIAIRPAPEPSPPTYSESASVPSAFPPGVPLGAKQNLQQGMTYVSLAVQNPKKAYENYENAILEFTRAIEQYQCYATAYSNRAVAFMQQKKFNNALNDLTKAIECDPKDPIAHYNLAALHSIQDRGDLGLVALDKSLGLGFNDYDALRSDSDLNNVRKERNFRKVLDKHKIFLK